MGKMNEVKMPPTGTTCTARIDQNRFIWEISKLQDSIYIDLAHLRYCLNKITIVHIGEGSSGSLRITSCLSSLLSPFYLTSAHFCSVYASITRWLPCEISGCVQVSTRIQVAKRFDQTRHPEFSYACSLTLNFWRGSAFSIVLIFVKDTKVSDAGIVFLIT
jgi:hypothetical protein